MPMLSEVREGLLDSIENFKRIGEVDFKGSPWVGPKAELGPIMPMPGEVPLASGQTIERANWTASLEMLDWGGVGIHHYIHNGPNDNSLVQNCMIRRAKKWASRSYRTRRNVRFEHLAFFNTYPEHDIYHNIAGYGPDAQRLWEPSFIVRGCYSENAASQGVQLVQIGENRRYEQGFDAVAAGDWTPGGPLIVTDSLWRNAGRAIDDGNARAAFTLSFFESYNPVIVNRVFIDKSMQERSTGCLLIEKRQRATVRNFVALAGKAEQPLVLAKGVEQLVFENCFFQAREGQNWIDLQGCGRVTFRGCKGAAHINVDRNPVGPVTQDRTIGA